MTSLLTVYGDVRPPRLLAMDADTQMVFFAGKPCELTQQEFLLLKELALHADEPVSRDDLLCSAWGYICPGETRTVDVHVQRLRKKLGFACIETVYRTGYRLRAEVLAC